MAAAALILGGGGLVAVNVYASATEDGSGQDARQWNTVATVDCPDVGDRLTSVPDGARADVDKELAALDGQVADAYQRLRDSGYAGDAVVTELKEERTATIERIAAALDGAGERPDGLDSLAACTLIPADGGAAGTGDQAGQDQNQNQGQGEGGQQPGAGGQGGNGPVAADFADITTVQPNSPAPRLETFESSGTFTTSCGVNEGGLFNSDNVIVAPGVSNGAHHFHDYVGNQSNSAFASDGDLADADTSCEDQGDKSSYFWPVLRLQNGTKERDAGAPGGGTEGNAGEIVTPEEVTMTFVGNPRSEVTAMPRLLRIITGDAKAFVNGTANANASWSCTGFEDRQLKDKYPLCPQGSDVVRSFRFQSCWDGRNIDSANHRTHVAFAGADGTCPEGFKAIPQLVQRIVYDVDAPSLRDGGRTSPLFAVDSFPEQLHKPVTDHGDFINVFDDGLMREMADCINEGRQCGAGSGDGSGGQPQEPPATQSPEAPPGGDDGAGTGGTAEPGNTEQPGESAEPAGTKTPADTGGGQTVKPPAGAPDTEPADGGSSTAPAVEPKAETSPPATRRPAPTATAGGAAGATGSDTGGDADTGSDAVTAPEQEPSTGGQQSPAGAQTEPQAVRGGLADTGAQLWPAALGAMLVAAGLVVLVRNRRRAM